jgi:hypothetical protein
MTRPQYTPINRMVHDAIIGAAQEAPSSAPVWIANAMLDAYGEQHATAIADSLPLLICAEHTARLKGAAIRACKDPVDYPGAATVTDHMDLSDWSDGLAAGARLVRNVGIAACVALLAWGFWTAGDMTLDAVQRQIERGASEW